MAGSVTSGATAPGTVRSLRAALRRLFPAAGDAAIERAWSGRAGRAARLDGDGRAGPRDGLAWAGGYVGTGVAAANLAGRTLTDLILGRSTALTALPWVDHRVRRWEPEPLRWLGVRGLYVGLPGGGPGRAPRPADDVAAGRIADVVSGRH